MVKCGGLWDDVTESSLLLLTIATNGIDERNNQRYQQCPNTDEREWMSGEKHTHIEESTEGNGLHKMNKDPLEGWT